MLTEVVDILEKEVKINGRMSNKRQWRGDLRVTTSHQTSSDLCT